MHFSFLQLYRIRTTASQVLALLIFQRERIENESDGKKKKIKICQEEKIEK